MNKRPPTAPGSAALARLNDERDTLREFVVLLEREQKVLLGTDPEPLLVLAELKTTTADKLAALEKLRNSELARAGSTGEWLKKNAPHSIGLWEDIIGLAKQAHSLNLSNGALIQIKMRYNQQALAVLIGATQHAAGLYGPDGQTNLPNTGRNLGSV